MARALSVEIDGTPLPDEDARAFWARFSAWMESHPADLGGFARSEGLVSVHPEMRDGVPMLAGSRTAPQRPYTTAAARKTGTHDRTHQKADKRRRR